VTHGLTLPEGLATRPARPADVDAVTELIAECERADDGAVEVDRDDVASDLAAPGLDLERDTLLVFDAHALVAWAQVKRAGAFVNVDVHPAHQGRGIGRALMAWTERSARQAGGTVVRQSKTDANGGAAGLLTGSGYKRRWTSWILEIPLEGVPQPRPPEGIDIREFAPGRDDLAAYRVIDEAFDWELRGSISFEDWKAVTIARDTFDPSVSPVALDGEQIVGVALSLDYGPEAEGYVDQVAVAKPFRNRGIAGALLRRAFLEFRRKGRAVCTLSTDSRTGALALYEKAGMRIRRSYTAYVKDLTRSQGNS
jgi:mycothiol synthase